MNQNIKEIVEYCLNCPTKPCSNKGCPLNNDIPSMIKSVKEDDIKGAYEILSKTTVLPAICGRICPHFKQCMGSCVRGIKGEPVDIGEIETYVGDIAIKEKYKLPKKENANPKKIAIIGSGPAGLTAAAFLAMEGNEVTIYEKYKILGGILNNSIPNFRLDKSILKNTINMILELGINVEYEKELGKNLSLEELCEKYDNVILAFGANKSSKMGIEGENLEGVYGANELLEYSNYADYTGKTVLINGAGNVAMDTARTIKRLGAKRVIVIYRRQKKHMSAEKKEVEGAIKDGVEFLFQHNLVKIIGKKKVEKIELVETELVEEEGLPKPRPVNIEGTNYTIDVDFVIMAIGSKPADFVKTLGLELDKNGKIKVDENGKTSNKKIYAIGDLAGNKATIAWAARSGRDVAKFLT